MRIGRRDIAREAYRVTTEDGIEAYLPEAMMGAAPRGAPRHSPAYEWIAANRAAIETAIAARAEGRTPPAPFDLIELVEKTHAH